ncbi:hypothetical protein ACB092_07G084800 [Castanea dentata]
MVNYHLQIDLLFFSLITLYLVTIMTKKYEKIYGPSLFPSLPILFNTLSSRDNQPPVTTTSGKWSEGRQQGPRSPPLLSSGPKKRDVRRVCESMKIYILRTCG